MADLSDYVDYINRKADAKGKKGEKKGETFSGEHITEIVGKGGVI